MNSNEPAIGKILFVADEGHAVSAALDHAAALARQLKAELHVLRVLPRHHSAELSAKEETDVRVAKERLSALLPPQDVLDLSIHWDVRTGEAADEIVAYAQHASIDLIVMGARRRRALSRFLFGSVIDAVYRQAPCPVLAVPLDHEIHSNGGLLHSGAKTLREEYGESFSVDDETRGLLVGTLASRLELSRQAATSLLDRLESAEAVVWHDTPDAEGASQGKTCRIDVTNVLNHRNSALDELDFTALTGDSPSAPAFDLLHRAVALRATDVHIDPAGRDGYMVRFRIDGHLEHYCTLDRDIGEHLIARFKTLARLDIADPFEPQEGYLQMPEGLERMQVRVTTAPVEGGETVCLRVHEEERMFRPLEGLGLSCTDFEAVNEMLRRREGLIVVVGPTGAGKTTTIYSMLRRLYGAAHDLLIASIEDPVELNVSYLRQMSVNESGGLTLNVGLRTLLRLDPDVLFVGEIRDDQTAEMAMRAASSGRHVFTTLHSRDAAATITAFDDLNTKRRSLSANLTGIVSQRLIRRLCTSCRQRKPIQDDERRVFERYERDAPDFLWQAAGCDGCRGIGYHGRTAVFEVVIVEDGIREAIEGGAAEEELRQSIRSQGAPSLMSHALEKAVEGVTTVDEVLHMRSL